jgi:hypothetical protein
VYTWICQYLLDVLSLSSTSGFVSAQVSGMQGRISMKSEKIRVLNDSLITIDAVIRTVTICDYEKMELKYLSWFNENIAPWEARDILEVEKHMEGVFFGTLDTPPNMRIQVYAALWDTEEFRLPALLSSPSGLLAFLPGGDYSEGTIEQTAKEYLASQIGVSTHGINLNQKQQWGWNNTRKWVVDSTHEYVPDIIELEPMHLTGMWHIQVGQHAPFDAFVTWKPHESVMVITLVYTMSGRELHPGSSFISLSGEKNTKIIIKNHRDYSCSPELQVVLDHLKPWEWKNWVPEKN